MTAGFERVCPNPEATTALGLALGGLLQAGDFLALSGPLGAGKTHLIKGIAAGLGVPADEPVVSPTFVLVREYQGRLKLYHLDAYRLTSAAELLDLGLEEMTTEPGAVVAVEWAERVPTAVPQTACRIELEHVAEAVRRVRVAWPAAERLAALGLSFPGANARFTRQ
jgi:tRNA threonylcarbamoyladenosine biosynthesis protein TsaE